MNKEEAFLTIKKANTFFQYSHLPRNLEDYLYKQLKDKVFTSDFSQNYNRKRLTEQNWAELEQVLSIYFSPLNQALS